MDEDKELKELENIIRACIHSSKGPLTLRDLQRDYYTLENQPIPYAKFGYRNVEEFIHSFSTLRLCGSGQNAMVAAASSDSSKHVTNLIDKQKGSRKKPAQLAPRRGRGGYQSRTYQGPPKSYQGPPQSFQGPPKGYSQSSAPPPRNNSTYEQQSYSKPNAPPPRNHSTHEPQSYSSTNYTPHQNQSSSKRGSHISSSSTGRGYHGNYGKNLPPRFQAKKPEYLLSENVRDPLVVKFSDNKRQVVWKPNDRGFLITINNTNAGGAGNVKGSNHNYLYDSD